jgi:hypothetical protein
MKTVCRFWKVRCIQSIWDDPECLYLHREIYSSDEGDFAVYEQAGCPTTGSGDAERDWKDFCDGLIDMKEYKKIVYEPQWHAYGSRSVRPEDTRVYRAVKFPDRYTDEDDEENCDVFAIAFVPWEEGK